MKKKIPKRFHPAEYIEDEMEARGWSILSLAEKSMLSRPLLESLLARKRPVTRLVADGLAHAFDTSPQIWLNLQKEFEEPKP